MAGDYQRHAAFVYGRDQWICRLCDLPIAKNRKAPHPLAPSLDHIVPQAKGGSDEPDNLQAAHLRCNDMKHTKVSRSKPIQVSIEMPPWVKDLLERLPPAPEPEGPRSPLPGLSPDDIGDVFDRAVDTTRAAHLSRLPNLDQLRRWVVTKGFLNWHEARSGVWGQLSACVDDQATAERILPHLMREQSQAWFIAKFLTPGEGPEWLEDEGGWVEVADALVFYVGFDAVRELADDVIADLLLPDPLDLSLMSTSTEWSPPGTYCGHPLWAYEDSIRALKKESRLVECEQLLLALIETQEESIVPGASLSPHFYEQLAIVRRKGRNAAGEVEILERYFAHPGALPSTTLGKRLERARQLMSDGK